MEIIMIKMLLPIMLIVFSNVIYNLSAKFTPSKANSFLSLSVTYTVAAILSLAAFCFTGNPKQLTGELSKLNWSAFALGIAIIGLELGYIFLYRAGWKIGVGSLVANIALACILLVVGVIFFKEGISVKQLMGMAVCIIGLIMITQ